MNEMKQIDMKEEKEYLTKTKDVIRERILKIKQYFENMHKNPSYNSGDQYVQQQMNYMREKELEGLNKATDNPYFARIDFQKEGKEDNDKMYIGKCSVMKDDSTLQVIDWRTPVASLYYDGRLGDVSYEAPEGEIKGKLNLKRVYDIEKGELKSFSDVDIASNDELLKPYLSESSDNRLKNIISTIQTEQNKIIRAKLNNPIIVQGVAGSGKTTVALHRIAYLAYTYREKLKPEDFLIIAPNKFFLDYISTILPDLGVDDVSQLTFEEVARDIIGKNIKIENSNNKLANIVNNNINDNLVQNISKFKSSLQYKELLDNYLEKNGLGFFPSDDLKVDDIIILSKEKLLERFESDYYRKGLSMEEKFKVFTKKLSMFLENNQEDIENMIREKRTQEISKIDQSLSEDERKKQRIAIFDKYDKSLKQLERGGKKIIATYSKKAGKKSAIELYKEFVAQLNYEDAKVDKEVISHIQKNLLSDPKNKQVEYEDLAPLMYIQNKIKGNDIARYAKHIVIDEAQDYSEFQFAALKEILQNKSMTVLGDLAQGIYSYRGVNDWKKINSDIFDGEAEILDLRKSYRTTMEIMEKGNDVIDKIRDKVNVDLGEPVIRKGTPVNIEKTENGKIVENIVDRINELLSEDRKNIAVITKTLQEATEIHKKLVKSKVESNLISDKAIEYKGGVSVMPSYLSKGLEFDSVILSDASNEKYKNNELDAKLLYIAITRAMHTLDIYYDKEKSELLEEREKSDRDNKNIIELDER